MWGRHAGPGACFALLGVVHLLAAAARQPENRAIACQAAEHRHPCCLHALILMPVHISFVLAGPHGLFEEARPPQPHQGAPVAAASTQPL